MDRRAFLIGAGSLAASALLWRPGLALADTPKPYDAEMTPPVTGRDDFVKWMVTNRGEAPKFLGEKWDRYEALLRNHDVWDAKDGRAFLLTPREDFVRPANLSRAYDHAFLDIGYGVTISGPHAVARMTSSLDVKPGEKVLEIGTGSGYQSAYLSHLTDKVWSIEIIKPLAERTRSTYDWSTRATTSSRPSRPRTPTAITAGPRTAPSTRSSSPAASTIFRRPCSSS